MLRDCMRDESLARCAAVHLRRSLSGARRPLHSARPAVKMSADGYCLAHTAEADAGCRLVLEGPLFGHYFDKVEVSNFEVASDAFSTFKVLPPHAQPRCDRVEPRPELYKVLRAVRAATSDAVRAFLKLEKAHEAQCAQDLLTRHKTVVAAYLQQHYDAVGPWAQACTADAVTPVLACS